MALQSGMDPKQKAGMSVSVLRFGAHFKNPLAEILSVLLCSRISISEQLQEKVLNIEFSGL